MLAPLHPEGSELSGHKVQFGRKDLKQLGQVLRERRQTARLTQQELADAAGISVRTLGQIESGRSGPSLLTVVRIAEVLRVSIGELVEVARRDQRVAVHTPASAGDRDIVDFTRDLDAPRMQATLLQIPSSRATVATGHQRGEPSFGLVLDGVVAVAVRGGRTVRLSPGDAYHARGGTDCGWSGASDEPARLLRISMRASEDT